MGHVERVLKPELFIDLLKDLFNNWKRFLSREEATKVIENVFDEVYKTEKG